MFVSDHPVTYTATFLQREKNSSVVDQFFEGVAEAMLRQCWVCLLFLLGNIWRAQVPIFASDLTLKELTIWTSNHSSFQNGLSFIVVVIGSHFMAQNVYFCNPHKNRPFNFKEVMVSSDFSSNEGS